MANVQKVQSATGTTSYTVKFRTPAGQHRTKRGFPTKKAAQHDATSVDHARQRGAEFDPKAGLTTFRSFASLWLQSRHDLKASTHEGYRLALSEDNRSALSIDRALGGFPVARITRDHISAWVNRRAEAGQSPSTIRQPFFVVRMVLAQAVADGLIPANPADHVKLPTQKSQSQAKSQGAQGHLAHDDPRQFLTPPQIAALTTALADFWPYNVMVSLAAWSGLRAAELCGLQVGDVALPNSPITIATGGSVRVERTFGRGHHGQYGYTTPKTKGSRRTVPIPQATTALLAEYLARHPRADDPSAPLFPAFTKDGDSLRLDWSAPLHHAAFYKAVYRPAVARANLPSQVTFHALRHTYASLCVAVGRPPLEISRFMGHASVGTTLGIYAHLFPSDHSEAMSALDRLASQPALTPAPLKLVVG